jgi:glycosyltransferase involved in cell wall biosynthesis
MKKKILIIVKSEIEKSPRSKRFLDFCLKNELQVSLVSSGDEHLNLNINQNFHTSNNETTKVLRGIVKILKLLFNIKFIQIFLNKILFNLSEIESILKQNEYDYLYFADIDYLPTIINNRNKAIVLFDAREYYPLQFENNINFRRFEKVEYTRILKNYLSKCDIVFTVSVGLAEAYRLNFSTSVKVVYSSPYFKQIHFRKILNNKIKFLYHGMANRNRKIENFFELLKLIKFECELHLYLVGDKEYINELKNNNISNHKIKFHDPVKLGDIVEMASNYDIGLCYFEPATFNLKHCLPNKFFEYIQARIIVASGPSPDMAKILEKYSCGVVSKEFTIQSLADSINSLSLNDLNDLKKNSMHAASVLCFEEQEMIFKNDLLLN